MKDLEILARAFEYIEDNLQAEIKTQDVADACYCSKSVLEKIFRCVNNIGVHEYVVRRRMMLAAKFIRKSPETSLLDIAVACGYSTNESFSRAFKSVWNCNPSEFKSRGDYPEIFPRLYPPIQDGGTFMSERKHVDISEMYDLFVKRRECYFVCCDIKSLIPINEIAHKAGDLAILEAIERMQREAGEEDVVFRIGGDEFVMLTASTDIEYANAICERISSHNGEPIVYEGQSIPLSLYTGVVKFNKENLRYRDLFEQLHTSIVKNK